MISGMPSAVVTAKLFNMRSNRHLYRHCTGESTHFSHIYRKQPPNVLVVHVYLHINPQNPSFAVYIMLCISPYI